MLWHFALERGCCVSCVGMVFGFLISIKAVPCLKECPTKQAHKCHVSKLRKHVRRINGFLHGVERTPESLELKVETCLH